ncbi:MAG TPA: glycosyltransferase family 4 protein [Terracidiphilus sp.]|nr:glycosyltransferase family 4 protein [Terracidiphilus sp.]
MTSAQTGLVLHGRVRALRDAGFRVSLLSAPGELLEKTARAEQVDTFAVAMERGIAPIRDVVALIRIWRLLRRLKPDIVEFSTPKAGLLGMLAARFCGIPARIYFLRGLKLETSRGLLRMLLLWAERVASASAVLVVCNSRSLHKRALALGIGPASKLVVLGEGSSNGVNLTHFAPGNTSIRRQFGIAEEAPVIGFSGRLTIDKGLPELLEAFAGILRQVPDAYLLLVGWFDAAEDALDQGMRARIEGHPRIICTGYVEDTAPYYRAMNLMVLPSWREGFPNVVLEAAASGVPVIATHCTGSCDAVVSEVTGLLIPVGSPEAISEAVLSLLGDADRRRRMSAAARAWVAENYEDRRVLGLAVSLYMSLITPRDVETCGEDRPAAATGLPARL